MRQERDTTVSIIIPVYKRAEWIQRCLEKLAEQRFAAPFEIIVVDDGSPNAEEIGCSLEGIQEESSGIIRFLKGSHAGPAATRNRGVRSSSGRILCFLDDDSLPDENWLSEITRLFGDHPSPAIVSGKTLSYYRQVSLPLLLEEAVYAGKSWATCNIAYRRDAFDSLGGFDESFREPSWEDNDLGLRARWAGFAHVYNDRAVVYHPHEQTIDEYRRKCLLNGRGAARFASKYLLHKPVWGFITPVAMSRRLLYGLFPSVWMRNPQSKAYVKFLWSYYSLQGFIGALAGK